jgi:S-adenosylmethionine synthetase
MSFLFTSESVTGGHPDKLADAISDAVLDAHLATDPNARVACETFVTRGLCLVGGEVRSTATVDLASVTRRAIEGAGYGDPRYGYPADGVGLLLCMGQQSPEIAQGVDRAKPEDQGAGDQGLMFGYACRDTDDLMPLPIDLAHRLTRGLTELREGGTLPYLRPDGKSQVTVEFDDRGVPQRVEAIVVSTQHDPDVPRERIERDLREHLFPHLGERWQPDARTQVHVNATGSFVLGGPAADTGLTGRKIIVDTYGGWAPHGGGAFSGKDPSKVDRSACYMARYAAKTVVAAGLADACTVQVAYVIGRAQPVSLRVQAERRSGEGPSDADLVKAVSRVFPFTPRGIIQDLDLLRPIYRATAVGGHFGRADFPWERTDRVDDLLAALPRSKTAARR